nr:hypothetical protein [Salinispora arenicola]
MVVAAVLAELLAVWGTGLVPAVSRDVLPGKAKDFTLAQSEDEDQDVGGIQVVVAGTC